METKDNELLRISYRELAQRVGDCILNNDLQSELSGDYEFELFSGSDMYCYEHEDEEECKKNDYIDCQHESVDVYQTYIITQDGAEYLRDYTNEIVYHCEKLNIYLWGITHFGTSWSHVYTSVKIV